MAETAQYTVDVGPPPQSRRERFSKWEQLFEECRHFPTQWRRTTSPLKKSTASQLASDIRNSYHRDPEQGRLRGMRADERWEAAWGPGAPDSQEFYIWLRFMGRDLPPAE